MFDLFYTEQETDHLFIDRIDPRAKIYLFFLFIIILMTTSFHNIPAILALFFLLLLPLLFSGNKLKLILRNLIKI